MGSSGRRLRVLTAINVGYPVVGGAQITHQTTLQLLARQFGHDCIYLDSTCTRRRATRAEICCDSFRDLAELREKLEAYRPDVIIAAFTLIADVLKLARRRGIPVIAWLNSYEYCPPTPDEVQAWSLSLSHPYPTEEARAFALCEADRLVVNSHYLRQRLKECSGHEADVIYPAFDLQEIRLRQPSHDTDGYVTGICGYPHKGAKIFLELARRFPRERFLLVGAIQADYFPAFQQQSNITLLPFSPPREFLARAKIVLVPSQWDEPFGRIAVETMANAIPTLVSHQAGLAEIVGDSSLGVRHFQNVDAWARQLALLLDAPQRLVQHGEEGQALAARFLENRSVVQADVLIRDLAVSKRSVQGENGQKVIALAGQAEAKTAFAMINARMQEGLHNGHAYRLHVVRGLQDFVPEAVDVVIHHDYTQKFSALVLPAEGYFIAVRTWDFGRFPREWVQRINQECDQLWVYSRWVRQQALLSGVVPSKVKVIPQGIDPALFRPDGPGFPLTSDKRCKFLFVGATVLRKGVDILLDAYRQAFSATDDVCLVIKDNPKDVFYEGQRWKEEIRERLASPTHPQVVYIDDFLSPASLAALYRSCDVGVFPYRAEGFALPILEAMACGTPSIVPRFGACLDFCSTRTSFLLPVKRINLPVMGDFAMNTLGFREEIDEVDFCEMPVPVLAERLRSLYEEVIQDRRRGLAARGEQGIRTAHGRFAWKDTVRHLERALTQLEQRRTPARFRWQRQNQQRHHRVFAAARALFLGLDDSNELPVRG